MRRVLRESTSDARRLIVSDCRLPPTFTFAYFEVLHKSAKHLLVYSAYISSILLNR